MTHDAPSPRPADPAAPVVYVHIPKAAGTTLKDAMARVYAGRPMLFFLPRSGELERFAALPASARARFAVVAGHEPFGLHRVFDGTGLTPSVITVLRDPLARVGSLFHYIHREPGHPLHRRFVAERMTIAEVYLRVRAEPFDNHQVRFLAGPTAHGKPFGTLTTDDLAAAKRNLSEGCAAFGLQERFDESLAWFARALGWPDAGAGRLNVSPARPEGFTDAERSLVLEHNALDRALYEYAIGLFEERSTHGLEPRC